MMKKNLFISIAVCLLSILLLLPMQAATLTGSGMPILVTEVAAMPSPTQDFGQLVEIYNNTDADLDLYDYEFDLTTSRHNSLETQMSADKFRGGFYATNERGKIVLKSGELAVIWIVFEASQRSYTEANVRTIMGSIPAGVKIIRVDTTDSNYGYGPNPNIDRTTACYIMANKRGCYAAGGSDATLGGAYVRIYGQTGQGKSQLYGDVGNGRTPGTWQNDVTATTSSTDYNVACNFGSVHETQTDILKNVYIPSAGTTAPSNTTSPSTGDMAIAAAAAAVAVGTLAGLTLKRRFARG